MNSFLLILWVSFISVSDTTVKTYTGTAYDLTTNEVVYFEKNQDFIVEGKHQKTITKYYNKNNVLFAERTLDFSKSSVAPEFTTKNYTTGSLEGAKLLGNNIQLFYKENKKEELKEKLLGSNSVVVDGGFHHFLLKYKDQLHPF